MRFQRLFQNLTVAGFLLVCCGCVKNIYVAPNAVIENQPDTPAPITVGLLIPQSVRDAWYPRATTSKMLRRRVDVPVGNLALDYARTAMAPFFEDFYILRYKGRRSEKGYLAILKEINYDLKGETVMLQASVTIEDEQKNETFKKNYDVTSDAANSGLRVPFLSKSPEEALEVNTAAVYNSFYNQLVQDIYKLTGYVKPTVEPKPQPTKATDTTKAPAVTDKASTSGETGEPLPAAEKGDTPASPTTGETTSPVEKPAD